MSKAKIEELCRSFLGQLAAGIAAEIEKLPQPVKQYYLDGTQSPLNKLLKQYVTGRCLYWISNETTNLYAWDACAIKKKHAALYLALRKYRIATEILFITTETNDERSLAWRIKGFLDDEKGDCLEEDADGKKFLKKLISAIEKSKRGSFFSPLIPRSRRGGVELIAENKALSLQSTT